MTVDLVQVNDISDSLWSVVSKTDYGAPNPDMKTEIDYRTVDLVLVFLITVDLFSSNLLCCELDFLLIKYLLLEKSQCSR